jgi:hypothetical protein
MVVVVAGGPGFAVVVVIGRFVIVFAGTVCVIVRMIVGMGMLVTMTMIVIVIVSATTGSVGMAWTVMVFVFVMSVVVFVITRIAVGVVVRAHAHGPVPVQEVECRQEDEADARDQGIDPEAGVEVFFDPSARVKIEEESAPEKEREQREQLEKFLHGCQGKGFPGRRIRVAAKRNSGRRSRQRGKAREGKQSAI